MNRSLIAVFTFNLLIACLSPCCAQDEKQKEAAQVEDLEAVTEQTNVLQAELELTATDFETLLVLIAQNEMTNEFDATVRTCLQSYRDAIEQNTDATLVTESLEQALRKQYEAHVRIVEKSVEDQADDSHGKRLELLKESQADYLEARMEVLSYESDDVELPEMIAGSFAELCTKLGIHIDYTHAIREGAPDPNMITVVLKLPHMDCGGCAALVKEKLESIDGVHDIATSVEQGTCHFQVARDIDYASQLDEMADSIAPLKDWSQE